MNSANPSTSFDHKEATRAQDLRIEHFLKEGFSPEAVLDLAAQKPVLELCNHYEQLYAYMAHDKKNVGGKVNFTLLGNVGDIRLDQHATKDELFDMFDFLREGT